VLTWLIARHLGIEAYGLYVILWSFVLLLGSIQTPFIINPMLTLGSKAVNKDKEHFFSSYFYFQFAFSLFSVVAMYIIYFAAKLLNIEYSFIVFTGTVLYGISYNYYEFCRRYLLTVSSGAKILISDTLTQVSLLLVVFIAWYNKILSLELFLYASFFVYLVSTLLILWEIKLPSVKRNFLVVRFKNNLKYSTPMMRLSVSQFFSGHYFIYIAVYLLGQNIAGVVGVLRNVFAPLVVGLMALDNSMPQQSMRAHEDRGSNLSHYMRISFLKWLLLFIAFSVAVVIFGDYIVVRLYGQEYMDYAGYLSWFAATHILMLGVRVLAIYARTINRMKVFTVQALVTLLFTLISTYPLIHFLGLNGAFAVMTGQQLLMIFVLLKNLNKQ